MNLVIGLVAIATQVVGLATAVITYRLNRGRIREVRHLVNNQLDRQLDRNAELTATLTSAGVDVPRQAPGAHAEEGAQ